MKLNYVGKTIHPLRSCSMHSHPCWELVYNETGSGKIYIDEDALDFREGRLHLYPPNRMHKKVSQGTFEDYYVSFSEIDLTPEVYCFDDTEDQTFLLLIRLLYQCFRERGADAVCANLTQSLETLVKEKITCRVFVDKNAQRLRQIILDGFADTEFKIQDAMEQIPLHADYLRRCFKAAYSMTPQEYLLQVRIENAKQLLIKLSGDGFGVAEAAYLSGFYDSLYFSRVFKKYTGIAPSQWKKK